MNDGIIDTKAAMKAYVFNAFEDYWDGKGEKWNGKLDIKNFARETWNAAVANTKKRCAKAMCEECRKYNPGKAEHWDGEKCGEYNAIMEVE